MSEGRVVKKAGEDAASARGRAREQARDRAEFATPLTPAWIKRAAEIQVEIQTLQQLATRPQ